MRFSKILNFGKLNRATVFIGDNKEWMILSIVLIVGSLFGICKFSDSDFLLEFSEWFFKDYYDLRTKSAFFQILLKSFLNLSLPIVVALIISTTPVGIVLLPGLVFFFGYFSGSLTAYLYSEYALKGIAFNAVMIFPVIFPFIVVLLAAAVWGLKFSSYCFSGLILQNNSPDFSNPFKQLITRYLILISVLILISLIDSVLSIYLLDKFI